MEEGREEFAADLKEGKKTALSNPLPSRVPIFFPSQLYQCDLRMSTFVKGLDVWM